MMTGGFSQAWKHALVIPYFKKGDPNNVSNYRPISLLLIASKILEEISSNQLTSYLLPTWIPTSPLYRISLDSSGGYHFCNMDDKKISLLTLRDLSVDSASHYVTILNCLFETSILAHVGF